MQLTRQIINEIFDKIEIEIRLIFYLLLTTVKLIDY